LRNREELPAIEPPALEPVNEQVDPPVFEPPVFKPPVVEELPAIDPIKEMQRLRREARIAIMEGALHGLDTALAVAEILEPADMVLPRDLCAAAGAVNAPTLRFIEDRTKILRVLDANAGTVTCHTDPDIPRICLQVDEVIKVDGTMTTLCGDSDGNVVLGGICQIPFGAPAGTPISVCR
jgi:hypothetical protein